MYMKTVELLLNREKIFVNLHDVFSASDNITFFFSFTSRPQLFYTLNGQATKEGKKNVYWTIFLRNEEGIHYEE